MFVFSLVDITQRIFLTSLFTFICCFNCAIIYLFFICNFKYVLLFIYLFISFFELYVCVYLFNNSLVFVPLAKCVIYLLFVLLSMLGVIYSFSIFLLTCVLFIYSLSSDTSIAQNAWYFIV